VSMDWNCVDLIFCLFRLFICAPKYGSPLMSISSCSVIESLARLNTLIAGVKILINP